MTNVFEQIDKYFANDPPGWTTPIAAKTFASCVIALRPNTIIEIGVFGGRTTISMALALREVGRGMITAIDAWSAKASIVGMSETQAAWWKNQQLHEDARMRFLSDLATLGVQNCVKVVRASSDDVTPPLTDFLIIDGNHGPQAIVDVNRFAPSVRDGGLVYLNDLTWEGGNVTKASQTLISMGFNQLYTIVDGAMYQRFK